MEHGAENNEKGRKRQPTSPISPGSFWDYKKLREYLSSASSDDSPESDNMGDKTAGMDEIDKIVKTQMDEYKKNILAVINKQRLDLLDSLKKAFSKRFDDLEHWIDDLEMQNHELKKQLSAEPNTEVKFKHVIQAQETRIVELEQYSRRANIKIFGVPEVKPGAGQENPTELVINICKTHLELNISNSDILAAHRIPSRNNNIPRKLYVKFLRTDMQERVLRQRRKLKGKPINIADDLCLGMQGVLNRAKNDDRVSKAWSWRGKVFFQHKGSEEINQLKFGEPLNDKR